MLDTSALSFSASRKGFIHLIYIHMEPQDTEVVSTEETVEAEGDVAVAE